MNFKSLALLENTRMSCTKGLAGGEAGQVTRDSISDQVQGACKVHEWERVPSSKPRLAAGGDHGLERGETGGRKAN